MRPHGGFADSAGGGDGTEDGHFFFGEDAVEDEDMKVGMNHQVFAKPLIYRFYLCHMPYVKNWDLVDSSAAQIVGAYLFEREKVTLREPPGSMVVEGQSTLPSCIMLVFGPKS